MITLRCTRKLATWLTLTPGADAQQPTNKLGDWYANPLNVGYRRLIHCVSEKSLLSVVVPAKNVRQLPSRLPDAVRSLLARLRVPTGIVESEIAAMLPITVGLTRSRIVVGSMVEGGQVMSEMGNAIVVGVGPEAGLGGAVCKRLAREGFHVFVAGRSRDKVEKVALAIRNAGGRATAVPTDTTIEKEVIELFDRAEKEGEGPLEVVVYNAGNAAMGELHDMEAGYFEQVWRVGCFGGFLVGREAVRRLLPRGRGTVIFTGATASMRGKPATTAFAAAKAGLRSLAQSMARAYGPKGIHVAHVVVDGGIAGDKIIQGIPQFAQAMGEDGLVSLDGLAEAYWYLHTQPRAAWTHELDIRPFKESF